MPGNPLLQREVRTYMLHLEMTRTIPAGSVDLVVWAEGSTGSTNADPILVADVADAIGDEAARIGHIYWSVATGFSATASG